MSPYLYDLENFLWSIAVKKAVARGVQALVAMALAVGASDMGIDLNPDLMTIAVMVKLEALRNYLKVKRGWSSLP